MKKILLILLFLIFISLEVETKDRIGNIYIDKKEVFNQNDSLWFFNTMWLNNLHLLTKDYIISDELLFEEEDDLDEYLFEETERNLRALEIFSDVTIELDSVNEYFYDVYITTKDRWSTSPNILFGTGGKSTNYGLSLSEYNFLGTASSFEAAVLYRTENKIGPEGLFILNKKRLFRSEFGLDYKILAHRFRTEQSFSFNKPFRTLNTEYSFGINAQNNHGSEFYYKDGNNHKTPFHQRIAQVYFSRAWKKMDRVFVTCLLEMEDVDRAVYGEESLTDFSQAFDNSGKILIAFSSVAEEYFKTTKLNSHSMEDLQTGGWGSAILGKIFPIGKKGEGLYYVAGQGERSWIFGDLYLFGQITGASAFESSIGKYTYQDFLGLGFYRLSDNLLLTGRFKQQTVWNWRKYRQLVLDNDEGLRGYKVNSLAGDNRVITNFEMRYFPNWEFWLFKFGGAIFFDTGTVWDQETDLSKTRWHSSAGFGIRIENMKSYGPGSVLRIDFAFNFDERRFAEIIFTSDHLFSVFKKHIFNLPKIYGSEIDYQ